MPYICNNCGAQFPAWEGRCPVCHEWGTIAESLEETQPRGRTATAKASSYTSVAASKGLKADAQNRLTTGFAEMDRVLGGGLVPGEVVLLSGEPGIGKSTVLLQLALNSTLESTVLYVSGEESVGQLMSRVKRVSPDRGLSKTSSENFKITVDTQVDRVAALISELKPKLVIVDSVQSLTSPDVRSYAGSITQVRVTGQILARTAKELGIPVILVGQITKEGLIAGPKVLEHTVDCVLYLEGDEYNVYRILRSAKNRFGTTDEIGVFEMSGKGFSEIANPSLLFLSQKGNSPGSCISAVLKGSRVVFIEVQALVVEHGSVAGPLRRVANGLKKQRVEMLSAVLSRRGNIFLGDKDVFVNVVGGMTVDNPAIDLAICAAIKSAISDAVIPAETVYLGEVGLTGEVRGFYGLDSTIKEAKRLGYKELIVPEIISKKRDSLTGIKSRTVGSIKEV